MANENWKVLIIDDEQGIRNVLSIALTDAGYDVLTAADGGTGVQLFEAESPQIVVTDVRMPGMDGIEVLQKIKAQDPNAEVIVVTGFGEIEQAIRALQLKASDFITKPIHDDALFVALERAKHHFSTRRELEDYTKLIEAKWMDTADELARTFNFQNNLIESSIDGILGCDEKGNVIVFNKSIESMSGYSKAEVRKKMSFDRFLPVGMAEKFREDLASDEYGGEHRLFLYETHLLTKQGDQVPVQVSATVLFEEKREAGMVVFFQGSERAEKTRAAVCRSSPPPAAGQDDLPGQTGGQRGARNQQPARRYSQLRPPHDKSSSERRFGLRASEEVPDIPRPR